MTSETVAKAFITDCDGLELSAEERAFLEDERPWGFILFGRNVEEPAQVAELNEARNSLAAVVGEKDDLIFDLEDKVSAAEESAQSLKAEAQAAVAGANERAAAFEKELEEKEMSK